MTQRKDPIKTNNFAATNSNVAFITFDPNKPEEAANAMLNSNALSEYQSIASRTEYQDIHSNTSIRPAFSRADYEEYRPGERIPTKIKDVISAGNRAYKKVGIVRNIIDLMADFGAQGVRLTHPNKRQQRVARRWFTHKVNGEHTTERFLNYFYRLGTAVARRRMAKLNLTERQRMAIANLQLKPTEESDEILKTGKFNIPSGYNFLNPLTLESPGGELSQFVGKQIIALKLTGSIRSKIMTPTNELERKLVEQIPQDIKNAVQRGEQYLILDINTLSIHYYKKDDWEDWGSPMIEAILDDLLLLEKMKLADLAALDGAISQIRIWRLGDLEKGIIPTDTAIGKLADILLSNPGGGAFDIIWGPELTCESLSTDVHKFLGGGKYEPVYDAIHGGLGVPPTLTGSANQPGLTNNFISLQTLVKRLDYGRKAVKKFWEQECELFRQAMGWQRAPSVQFDRMILTDEAAEKALSIQMYERNLISEELVLERFGESPEIEDLRKRREDRERKKGTRLPQAGPYYASEKMHQLLKGAMEKGYISPEEAGIEVDEEADTSKKRPFDKQMDMMKMKTTSLPSSSPQGKSGQGRPRTSKDSPSTQRSRTPKIRTSADMATDLTGFLNGMVWAKQAQEVITELISPVLLEHYKKKNMRSLSAKEVSEAEHVKFRILANLPKYSKVDSQRILEIANGENK
ncbi:MAG: hypothetical protein ACYSUN_14775, partial [Planctomycetota bacterium]